VTNGPFEGSATLNDDQAKALTSGQTYFNIHTDANKGGEVRGQVTKS
jgi:CHRD domain-containing protein